ncbi:L-seryl-tRNA(Sec) selenium transferase [Trebonia kvetii]|uniref:L-seryl-tRNA(Sec) selenium transferase n=1 Tax=Trebonia kvetii TaxID=2480626 RepID=UPI001FEA44D5|nr:L-seryl-tRNA(Sec) selenium transferase [Trebonia kvetii]
MDDLAHGAHGGDGGAGDSGSTGHGGRAAPDRALLRQIPRTDQLLADPRLRLAADRLGRDLVKAAVTRAQGRARAGEITPDRVADAAVAELPATAASLTPVINATGVLVHTNLGRAPLSRAARDALLAAAGTCDIEFDLDTGARSPQRGRGVIEALRRAVPAAGAAGVVNNNAAALVLAATALAGGGREIVISRGELIEIGDRFRLPDLLASTGARLREVGTTNRTTVEDYQQALSDRIGFILKVHPSNYRVEGFTRQAGVAELAALNVTLVHDIGSGLLAPHPLLPDEPDAASSLAQGANLVTASGDKLLGGPQAGILLGDEPLVRTLLRHPLARALRVDKLTLAALEATISGPLPPVARSLTALTGALSDRAERLAATLTAHDIPARVVDAEAAVGGGGAPGVTLPSVAIALPEELATALRHGPAVRRGESPAVAGRVAGGALLLDLRSVDPADDERLVTAVLLAAGH